MSSVETQDLTFQSQVLPSHRNACHLMTAGQSSAPGLTDVVFVLPRSCRWVDSFHELTLIFASRSAYSLTLNVVPAEQSRARQRGPVSVLRLVVRNKEGLRGLSSSQLELAAAGR